MSYKSGNNTAGRWLEDFLYNNMLQVVDTKTIFLPHAGGLSGSDLVITHPNVTLKLELLLNDPSISCHHAILVKSDVKKKGSKQNRLPRRNLKKANWEKFKEITDSSPSEIIFTDY